MNDELLGSAGEEDPHARIEVRRDGTHILIRHTYSGATIRLTLRQALAVAGFLRLVHDEIADEG